MNTATILSEPSGTPDLRALRDELGRVLGCAGAVRASQNEARAARLQEWDGQSADCRKHGGESRPFEGAADTRPMVVDAIVNERVSLLVESLMGGDLQCVPLGSDGLESSAKVSRLLRWVRDVQLQAELRREAELLANYQEGDDPGLGVLKVWWRRTAALEMRVLGAAEISRGIVEHIRGLPFPQDARQMTPELEAVLLDVSDLLANPLREKEAGEALAGLFPTVRRRALNAALRELRERGETSLPLPFDRENRLSFTALRFMEDVFFPPDCDDIQRARAVFEREFLSSAELRARAAAEGWESGFAEAVIEAGPGPHEESWEGGDAVTAVERESDNLYEVWWAYTRTADDFGIEGVYVTLFSGAVPDAFGRHELLDCPDGEYPFVVFRREMLARGVQTSRGVPRLAASEQYEIKLQRDCFSDYTQLTTMPPLKVSMRRGGIEAVLGPMVQVPVRDRGDVEWMTPPPFPAMGPKVVADARAALNEYFGRLSAEVPPELRQALLQKLVNSWLDTWVDAWRKGLQLLQTYMPDVEVALAAGGGMRRLSRDEVRGSFRAVLKYNIADLNIEFVMKRMQAIAQLIPLDRTGTIDLNTIIRVMFRGIDPILAETGLRDTGTAQEADRKDEQQALALMAQGIEPDPLTSGVNAQMRLVTLQEALQKSPVLQRRLAQPGDEGDEFFRRLVENRMKNLQFQVQQYQENPMIGRTGVKGVASSG